MALCAEEAGSRRADAGGDSRLGLDPGTGLNRHHSAPRPSDALAYASSTAAPSCSTGPPQFRLRVRYITAASATNSIRAPISSE